LQSHAGFLLSTTTGANARRQQEQGSEEQTKQKKREGIRQQSVDALGPASDNHIKVMEKTAWGYSTAENALKKHWQREFTRRG
jgi:hypothetical protein